MTTAQSDSLTSNQQAQALLRELTLVWLAFERRLSHVPIIQQLEEGDFAVEHYCTLLRNLRPQVVEGARWITRAASSFTSAYADLRSTIIVHAYDEHRDYKLLENDYVAIGGAIDEIRSAPRNIGTEALTAFLMHQASQPDPIDLLGAMFIIEGLGQKMAQKWARQLQRCLNIPAQATSFLSYHGNNDENHMEKLQNILVKEPRIYKAQGQILKTARIVARLYLLQLEEIDNV